MNSDDADIETAGLEDVGDGYYRDPATGEIYDSVTGDWLPAETPQLTFADENPSTNDSLNQFLEGPQPQQTPAQDPTAPFTLDQLNGQLPPPTSTDDLEPWRTSDISTPDALGNHTGDNYAVTTNYNIMPTASEFAALIRAPRAGDPPLAGDPRWTPGMDQNPLYTYNPNLPPKPDVLLHDPGMPPPPPPPRPVITLPKIIVPPVIIPPVILPPKPVVPVVPKLQPKPGATKPAPTSTSASTGASSSSGWLLAAGVIAVVIVVSRRGRKTARD